MAAKSDPFENRHSYIPPSIQKSISEHMDRTMPVHLKKYHDNETRHIPEHAEKAMSEHMQKSLPGHLKQYAEPYLQQNVVWANTGNAGSAPATPPATGSTSKNPRNSSLFSVFQRSQNSEAPNTPPPESNKSQDPYDFIMNPEKSSRQPLNLFTGGSPRQKAIFAAAGFMLLIMIIYLFSGFLNGASNAQRDRLLAIATTETEIIRIAEAGTGKLTDRDALNFAATVKSTVASSKQQFITALVSRGKEVKDKDISIQNPANDTVLTEGEQNGRYNEAHTELLKKLLVDYQAQLVSAYEPGNTFEKQIIDTANNQINMLLETD
ncbi:MAG TPA: hypothetical protein VFX86_03580 [Candidatus Saccharimonadales bacterium]|nr:hypothetical protein [Candidatus Saccharimonadales bacterium]